MPQIRQATLNDLKAIQRLNQKLFIFEQTWLASYNENWPYLETSKQYFQQALKDDSYFTQVCENNDEIIGYMLVKIKEKPALERKNVHFAELDNTFIEEKFRQRGLGKEMFKNAKNWAKQHGATHFKVGMAAGNKEAQTFYKNLNFHPYEMTMEQPL